MNPDNMQFRLTPQRMLILKLLKKDTTHPSAEEVYKRARKNFPGISFKTVYNTLQVLQDNQLIQELIIDRRKKRYCPDPKPHHHIICTECNKVVDIHLKFNTRLHEKRSAGFKITGSKITFYGICPECNITV